MEWLRVFADKEGNMNLEDVRNLLQFFLNHNALTNCPPIIQLKWFHKLDETYKDMYLLSYNLLIVSKLTHFYSEVKQSFATLAMQQTHFATR